MEREKSKKQREELLKAEREQRRQRRKERKEREEQVRDAMHVAAETAKSKALELGCTNNEALAEAAAAASKVIDDESTTIFSFMAADSDEGSFVDDCFTDADEEENTSIASNLPLMDHSVDIDESNDVAAVQGAIDNLSLLDEEEESSVASSKENEEGNDVQSCSSPTSHQVKHPRNENVDINLHQNSEVLATSPCSQHDMDEKEYNGESNQNQSQAQVPLPEDDIQTTTADYDPPPPFVSSSTSPQHELPPSPKPRKTRRFCDMFPSFRDLFTNHRKGSSADATERELVKSMRFQSEQYTRSKSQFVESKCSDDADSGSDDDADEDDIAEAFDQALFYRVKSHRPEVASILDSVFSHHLLSSTWSELPLDIEDKCWNLMWVWGMPAAEDFANLLVFQKINRFRSTRGLTRKDLLSKNMLKASFNNDSIMPLTYTLPHEYNSFVSAYQSIQTATGGKADNIWIIKPVGLSRGRGIFLVSDPSMVTYSQPIVIQRYISDPLCFMGFKFDLRIYVLVASFNPLEAFIYKEGLARFGTRQYSRRPELLADHRIHLTNTSIQREFGGDAIDTSHPAYLAGAANGSGNKVAFTWLWKRLESQGADTKAMWEQMINVCHQALVSVESSIPHQRNAFEIFGFDLMFDQSYKCWLIEVNSSPSFGCDSPLDIRIKGSLIRDTIALVSPPSCDRKALVEVCHRRLTHRKSASSVSNKDVLEEDLARILKNKLPRRIGEAPKRMGNFAPIC